MPETCYHSPVYLLRGERIDVFCELPADLYIQTLSGMWVRVEEKKVNPLKMLRVKQRIDRFVQPRKASEREMEEQFQHMWQNCQKGEDHDRVIISPSG